jgi:hypothetical protein
MYGAPALAPGAALRRINDDSGPSAHRHERMRHREQFRLMAAGAGIVRKT